MSGRIELGSVPPKIVQCRRCGKVRVDRAWARADFVQPDVIGVCPSCGRIEVKHRRWELDRPTKKRPLPADPFEGFRGE